MENENKDQEKNIIKINYLPEPILTKYLDVDKAKEQLNLQGVLNYQELTKQAPGIHEEEVERIARAWHDCTI